jgi:dephospho-CoA kinase
MPVIGITGGLATGKSLVTRLLQERGATTFSADEAARAVLVPGGPVLREVAQAFGPQILTAAGQLDREKLAQRIFADGQAREQLDRRMHPPILRLLRAQIEAAQDDLPPGSVIAVEVPLLYETNMQDWFDLIVVVTASESTQIARLRARNGLSEAEARRRLAAQWPLKEKAARADIVLENEGALAETTTAVDALWNRIPHADRRS